IRMELAYVKDETYIQVLVLNGSLAIRESSLPIDLFTAFSLTRLVPPVKKLTVHNSGDFMAIGLLEELMSKAGS
nr:hypothetical protein [Tanacetum cinerariifolium]